MGYQDGYADGYGVGGGPSVNDYEYIIVPWGTTAVEIGELVPGATYQVSVAAMDHVARSDGFNTDAEFTIPGDILAPSTPAVPSVTQPGPLTLRVKHKLGKAGSEYDLELDLDHLNVYMSTSTGFTPSEANKVGEISATAAEILLQTPVHTDISVNDDQVYFIVVTAVDKTGNESFPSAQIASPGTLITAQHIDAFSIRTTNLQVGDFDNLISHPDFIRGNFESWETINGGGSWAALETARPFAEYRCDGQNNAAFLFASPDRASITGNPRAFEGDKFLLRCEARWADTDINEVWPRLQFRWYDKAGVNVANDALELAVTNSWQEFEFSGTAPADVAYVVAAVRIPDGAPDTSKYRFSRFYMRRKVGEALIENAAITTAKIDDLAVTTAKIDALAVTTAKINDASITELKVVDGAITNAKIANLAVGTAKIKDAAIEEAKIGSAAVTNAKIANAAITNAKIASLDAGKITTGVLSAGRVSASNITTGILGSTYITSTLSNKNFYGGGGVSHAFSGAQSTGLQLISGSCSIMVAGSTQLAVFSGGTFSNNHMNPGSFGGYSLGTSAAPWSEVWALDDTINISDERSKGNISTSPIGLNLLREITPRRWQWLVTSDGARQAEIDAQIEQLEAEAQRLTAGASGEEPDDAKALRAQIPALVSERGNARRPGRRYHHGFTAQDVRAAMARVGIQKDDFAALIDIPDGPMALRYGELIAPIVNAIKELDTRVTTLETP